MFQCGNAEENIDEDSPGVLETLRRGTWADNEAERILKLTLQFLRKHLECSDVQQGGELHLKLFNSYKAEFRHLRNAWRQMTDLASVVDELSMATLRLRLRLPHELPGILCFVCFFSSFIAILF